VKLQKLSINPSIFVFRDPVDQFESMYNYVHFESKLSLGLEEFVEKYVRPGLPVRRVQGFSFFCKKIKSCEKQKAVVPPKSRTYFRRKIAFSFVLLRFEV
jgi:hypothetical protein